MATIGVLFRKAEDAAGEQGACVSAPAAAGPPSHVTTDHSCRAPVFTTARASMYSAATVIGAGLLETGEGLLRGDNAEDHQKKHRGTEHGQGRRQEELPRQGHKGEGQDDEGDDGLVAHRHLSPRPRPGWKLIASILADFRPSALLVTLPRALRLVAGSGLPPGPC